MSWPQQTVDWAAEVKKGLEENKATDLRKHALLCASRVARISGSTTSMPSNVADHVVSMAQAFEEYLRGSEKDSEEYQQ